jgi:hypothetical protein
MKPFRNVFNLVVVEAEIVSLETEWGRGGYRMVCEFGGGDVKTSGNSRISGVSLLGLAMGGAVMAYDGGEDFDFLFGWRTRGWGARGVRSVFRVDFG